MFKTPSPKALNRFLNVGMAFFAFWALSNSQAQAQCVPTSATLCATGDDVTTVYVQGNLLGTFPYAGAPGTNDPANPTCITVSTALLTGSQVCLAVETQNTAPDDNYSAWDLDITCSGGQHSEITSAGNGIQNYYNPDSPPNAPANDSDGNTWYSTAYNNSTGDFTSNYCSSGVTASIWAASLFDPTTGVQLPFIANNCSGDYSTSNSTGALFWRQCTTIPAPVALQGPPNFTIAKSQSAPITQGGDLFLTYTLTVCNTGGPVTNGSVTIIDNFAENLSGFATTATFVAWGYGNADCPFTMPYYNSCGQGNAPTNSGNTIIFNEFGNGCATLVSAAEYYYWPAGACATLVNDGIESDPTGSKTSNSVTFIATCVPTSPTVTATTTPTVGCGSTTYTTIATTYGPLSPGAGNCGFPAGSYDPNDYAAIISTDYANGQMCGACLAVQDAGASSVTVMVVDNCPTCGTAHQLDLGPSAWSTLTNGAAAGQANITWNTIPCPLSLMTGDSSGNIEYQWKTGCGSEYDPIQFLDMLFPVTVVSYSTSLGGTYSPLVVGANGLGGNEYWGTPSGNLNGTTGPFYFSLTGGGQSVTVGPLNVVSCGVTTATTSQLPGCGPANTPTNTATNTNTTTPTLTITPTQTITPTGTLTPGITQCLWNGNAGAACTWVQGTSTDSCGGNGVVSTAPQTETINQFYSYGASGVSVLYCSGSTAGANAPQSITMQSVPPAGATILKAFLDVVEYDTSDANPTGCTTAVDLGGKTTPTGVMSGIGNLWNVFDDPREGYDISSYPFQTAFNIRYDVTADVSLGTTSYLITYPNLCSSMTTWSASLVIVYTVPAPGFCGAVALSDGLFYWYTGNGGLRDGVTPYAPTLDWSCTDPSTSCGTNSFNVFGGSQYGLPSNETNPFTDNFYGSPSGGTAVSSFAATQWANCNLTETCGQASAFDQAYSNVPQSGTQKITWGLGTPLTTMKQQYWVNLLAAGCNAACGPTATVTATSSPTSTATLTTTTFPSSTPTNSFTITATYSSTQTPTATNTMVNTASATRTPTTTPTSPVTFTQTPTASPTNTGVETSPTLFYEWTQTATFAVPSASPTSTQTSTASPTPTNTKTSTVTPTASSSPTFTTTTFPSNTPTNTFTVTPTSTDSATATHTFANTPSPTFTLTTTPTRPVTFTATATNSPTLTLTPTSVPATPTATSNSPANTPTSTPVLTQPSPSPFVKPTPVIYPNPSNGGSLQLNPKLTSISNVRVEIFTVTFKKLLDLDFKNVPPGEILTIPLVDKMGASLASGLYYVVVQTNQGRSIIKLLILR